MLARVGVKVPTTRRFDRHCCEASLYSNVGRRLMPKPRWCAQDLVGVQHRFYRGLLSAEFLKVCPQWAKCYIGRKFLSQDKCALALSLQRGSRNCFRKLRIICQYVVYLRKRVTINVGIPLIVKRPVMTLVVAQLSACFGSSSVARPNLS